MSDTDKKLALAQAALALSNDALERARTRELEAQIAGLRRHLEEVELVRAVLPEQLGECTDELVARINRFLAWVAPVIDGEVLVVHDPLFNPDADPIAD